ncbi:hypothetical protein F8S13_00685 [Chloroflexia bacterium SDU3-3]|nr:hypothetical protein F8S13_00685 [Chloroflexia bacterium SDU3-3]
MLIERIRRWLGVRHKGDGHADTRDLVEAGWVLTRPCVELYEASVGDPAVALWGGAGAVAAPPGPYRHVISLDCVALALPQRGWLSVYVDTQSCGGGIVAQGVAPRPDAGGVALCGMPARSFPPAEALGRDLSPQEERAYARAYADLCPLYRDTAPVAVVGGWHFPWPDGDWEDFASAALLVWTFRDAEPWVEAWALPDGRFQVCQRIT